MSSSWVTPSPGTRCEAWRRRSAEKWGTSSVSCATASGFSSPTPRPAAATSRSTGPWACSDMTPYGRREAWEDDPEGWPEAPQADSPGRWAWGAHLLVLALGRGRGRHLGPHQPARAPMDPPRRDARRPSAARATTSDAGFAGPLFELEGLVGRTGRAVADYLQIDTPGCWSIGAVPLICKGRPRRVRGMQVEGVVSRRSE
jgi:hypothetical protein